MKQDMDKVQFESRTEVRELMRNLEIYIAAHPKENGRIKELYNILDMMDMAW